MYLNSFQQGSGAMGAARLSFCRAASSVSANPCRDKILATKLELQSTHLFIALHIYYILYLLHYSASLYILMALTLKARGTERSRG